jgi:hypothetical protein
MHTSFAHRQMTRMALWLSIGVLVARPLPAQPSSSNEPASQHATHEALARAEVLFYEAESSERAYAFATALSRYRASLESAPFGPFARRAQARVDALSADEADAFEALTLLERARLSPTTRDALDALATRCDQLRPTPSRARLRMFVAAEFVRLRAYADAAKLYARVANDLAATEQDRALAADELSRAHLALGNLRAARAALSDHRGFDDTRAQLDRLTRRARLHRAAWLVLLVQLSWGLLAVARAIRRRLFEQIVRGWIRPLPLAHIATLTFGGAWLTHRYDGHGTGHFIAFGAATLAIYLSATAANVLTHTIKSSSSPARVRHAKMTRATLTALAVLAVLGASFLSMYRFDPAMLEGLHL